MDLADKDVTDLGYRRLERYELGKGAILLNWDQLQQLPPGILNLTRTASLLDDDDDAEANINVDGTSATTPETYTGTRGSEKRDKADTIHIVLDTDDEDNSTSSGDHALSTVAQRRPPAPDLLDSGANRYVLGNTTATITDRKEARVTSLKNISGQPRRITQQATVQPLWVGGTGRTYSPAINNALIDKSLDFSLLPVSHFDTELHKAPVSKWASIHTTTAHTRERGGD
eukprot:g14703.t1